MLLLRFDPPIQIDTLEPPSTGNLESGQVTSLCEAIDRLVVYV